MSLLHHLKGTEKNSEIKNQLEKIGLIGEGDKNNFDEIGFKGIRYINNKYLPHNTPQAHC